MLINKKSKCEKATSRKTLSLIIVFGMLFAALTLIACSFNETTSTTKTMSTNTTTSIKMRPYPIQFNFEYGENFTEADIEVINVLNDRNGVGGEPRFLNLGDVIHTLAISNGATLYKVSVDIYEDPYFISAYGPERGGEVFVGFDIEAGCYAETFLWQKHEDYSDIPDKINDLVLYGTYAIYDCVIERDVINDIDYYYSGLYFVPLTKGFGESFDENNSNYSLCETVYYHHTENSQITELDRYTQLIIQHSILNGYDSLLKDTYELCTDENGKEYFVVYANVKHGENVTLEAYRAILGRLYDEMSPYFERMEFLDEEYINNDTKYTRAKMGIPIDKIIEYIEAN